MPDPTKPRSGRRDARARRGKKGWFVSRVKKGLRNRRRRGG